MPTANRCRHICRLVLTPEGRSLFVHVGKIIAKKLLGKVSLSQLQAPTNNAYSQNAVGYFCRLVLTPEGRSLFIYEFNKIAMSRTVFS